MPSAQIFRWLEGSGWLVFSADVNDDIRALALNRSAADGALAVIDIDTSSDQLLIDLEDMGAPAGYMVDPNTDEDPVVIEKLTDAGIVVVSGTRSTGAARGTLAGATLEGLQIAYESGAVILLEGVAAGLFGTWVIDSEIRDGYEWLEGVALVVTEQGEAGARELLEATPEAIVVIVRPGSAIVFGPDGQVETWGGREIVIQLGSAYGT